jgi:hypothetical protein
MYQKSGRVASDLSSFVYNSLLNVQLTLGQKAAIQAGGALAVFVILFFFAPR